jgi:hypothetical protein
MYGGGDAAEQTTKLNEEGVSPEAGLVRTLYDWQWVL